MGNRYLFHNLWCNEKLLDYYGVTNMDLPMRTLEFSEIVENLYERVKEMECLVALSQLSQQSDITPEIFLQSSVELLTTAWHYPESTCAKIFYDEQIYLTENFTTTPWFLRADIIINNSSVGFIEVYLIQDLDFLPEEKVLINTIAKFLSTFLESQQARELVKKSLSNYQEIFNSTNEALFIHQVITGKIVDVNDTMLRMYGYSTKEEVFNLYVNDLSGSSESGYTEKEAVEYLKKTSEEGYAVFEWLAKRANGEEFWVEVSLKSTEIGGKGRILAVVRDINLRKQQQNKIKYLTRLYATLSQINRCIITHKEQDYLFHSICDVAVKIGEFPLVWIGLIDFNTYEIKPFASAGKTTEYLKNIHITVLDEPNGKGPTGVAAREARLVICEDILNDPTMIPWRSQILKYGYHSSAGVPIKQWGKVIGVLSFYSEYVGFFTEEEQELLQEIGDNISFAIDAIESTLKHNKMVVMLRENEERLRLALKASNQGLYDLNIQTGEAIVSPEYVQMLGYNPATFQETHGKWIERLHPDDVYSTVTNYQSYLDGEQPAYKVEFRQRTSTGEWKWILSLGKIVEWDKEGKPLRMLGTHTDITDSKQAESQIEQLAYYDPLTSLPNRRLLFDRIENAIALAKRGNHYGALLLIDLDRFKTLNDACGHDAGDNLLKEVAINLQNSVRQADTVARFGGDEFIILLPELSDKKEIALRLCFDIATKIRHKLLVSFTLEGREFMVSASIGVTIFPKGEETIKDILKEADTAMYKAKNAGRNSVCLFETQMQIEAESRFALEAEIRHGLENKEFVIFLQPQVNNKGGIIGAEALIRWQHPMRGLVSPLNFIPLAEETGLIVTMGEWILEEVCQYLADIQKLGSHLRLSVNVSPYQFRQGNFVDQIKSIFNHTGVDPHYLTFEVTEGLIIEDFVQAIATITELQKLGIEFSIDDFGTGYSSLAYLKRLPINELKIDKSFVQDAPNNSEDAGLVEAIIAVANHFKLKIVAEGVETESQAEFLKVRGCNFYQGYLYGKPMPISEFDQKHGRITS